MAPELHSEALEQIFQDLAEVARAVPTQREYCEKLVLAALGATGARGAGVWLVEQQDLRGIFQLHLEDLLADEDAGRANEHVLRLALSTSRIQNASIPNLPESFIACPLVHGQDPRGVLVLAAPSSASKRQRQAILETIAALAEITEDYFYCVANRDLSSRVERLVRLEQFSHRLHRCVDRDELCFEIASTLPQVANCERVMVLLRNRDSMKLHAVTGVDTIDSRSETTVVAERLAMMVAKTGEPLWDGLPHSGQPRELPPQLESVLAEYCETCHPRAVLTQPLLDGAEEHLPQSTTRLEKVLGVIICEWSKHCPDASEQDDTVRATDHARFALANPHNGWFDRRNMSRFATHLATLSVLFAVALWFLLYPVPFQLEARGTLEPRHQYHVYAPADGEVERLFVQHGDTVEQGEALFQIRSLDLDRDLAELKGRRRELQTRLAVIELEALAAPQTIEEQRAAEALAAEEKQIRQQLEGLETTAGIINEQIESLVVRSPSRGKVVSWDLRHDWTQRQVRRGQPVLRVDQSDGPWELALQLPERRYGHLDRHQQLREVDVTFRLASDPEDTRLGTVSEIGMRAEAGPDGDSYVPVTVRVPSHELPSVPRAGATVTARLDCGTRPRGFVWFHQLIEYLRQRLFL